MHNKCILVVEDDEINRLVYQEILESMSLDFSILSHAEECIPYLNDRQPDLLILDVLMPRINGLQILKHIRSSTKTQHINVMIVSALAAKDEIQAGLEAGADYYMTKPFEADELMSKIRQFISIH